MSTPPLTSDPAAVYDTGAPLSCRHARGKVCLCDECTATTPPAAPAAGEAGLPGLLSSDQTKAAYDLLRTRLNEPFYAASGENSGQGGYDADEVEALVAELLAEKQEQWAYANDFREMLEASLKDNAALTARLTTEATAAGEAERACHVLESKLLRAHDLRMDAVARAEKAEARLVEEQAAAADQAAQLLQLHEELRGRNSQLVEALAALSDMWCQYCSNGHDFMSAGENAEDVLTDWHLMRDDGTAIDLRYDDDVPDLARALLPKGEPFAFPDATNGANSPAPLHRGTEEGEGKEVQGV